jgi:nucleotide-binding universal stress UspA family protein
MLGCSRFSVAQPNQTSLIWTPREVSKSVAVRTGSTAPAILDAEKALGADLIVMGTRGLSDFAGLLLGSVAHKVIHHVQCPVLVVR